MRPFKKLECINGQLRLLNNIHFGQEYLVLGLEEQTMWRETSRHTLVSNLPAVALEMFHKNPQLEVVV